MELIERERLVSGVLQKLARKVKALLVLIVIELRTAWPVVTVQVV